MKFQPAKLLVDKAKSESYSVPAFNTNGATYDITRAALEICQEAGSPLIMQVYEPNCAYRGFDYYYNLSNFLCDELSINIPVALQLDHGHSFDSVVKAMKAGFTGVMFDASHEPIDVNIAQTREVMKVARAMGVSVEAEIGYVKGNEKPKQKQIGRVAVPEKPEIEPAKTNLDEAVRFANETNVDMLAVSVGTTHGVYKSQTDIDYDLLKEISSKVSTPLVQHGTCGISIKDLQKLSKSGMSKINFGEPFRFNYIKYFSELTDSIEHFWHPWKIMQNIKELLKEDMKELIKALGSENKA